MHEMHDAYLLATLKTQSLAETLKQLAQVASSELFFVFVFVLFLFFFNKASSELLEHPLGKTWQASRVESVFLG